MGLFVGEDTPRKVFLGDVPYSKVFVGDAKIRPSGGGGPWTPGANTVIYYKFDGNLNDSSGNNNNGAAGGTVTYGTNYANLTSGYITVPNLTYNNTYTLSFWIKCNNFSSGARIIDGKTTDGGMFFRWEWNNSSSIFYVIGYPSYTMLNLGLSDNNWHLVTQVSDSSGIKYYLDGIQKATSSAFSGTKTMDGMKLGTGWNGTSPNNPGLYAGHFIIESVARTSQEIADYYNQTKGDYGIS